MALDFFLIVPTHLNEGPNSWHDLSVCDDNYDNGVRDQTFDVELSDRLF